MITDLVQRYANRRVMKLLVAALRERNEARAEAAAERGKYDLMSAALGKAVEQAADERAFWALEQTEYVAQITELQRLLSLSRDRVASLVRQQTGGRIHLQPAGRTFIPHSAGIWPPIPAYDEKADEIGGSQQHADGEI